MKKRNQLLALLLAGSLCSTNVVTTFAANNTSDENSISSESIVAEETETSQTEAPETETPQIETPEAEVPQAEVPETAAPQAEVPTEKSNDGWVFDGNYWCYYVDGEKITNCTYFIDGKWWLFDYNGNLACNQELQVEKEDSKEWYYFRSTSDGSLELGWYSDGTDWFYYDKEDGHRYSDQKFEVEGNSYYTNWDGKLLTSDWYVDREGKSYWADASGILTEKSTSEWVYANDAWYYYKDGTLLTDGIYDIDGVYYYFDYSGAMVTGSFQYYDEESGDYRYKLADENGHVLLQEQGWKLVGENYYYFEEAGWLATGKFLTISGEEYYFDWQGIMMTGQFTFSEEDGTESDYITKDSGAIYPECKTGGWAFYEGEWYYFKAPYTLAEDEFLDIDGQTYYFYSYNQMAKGYIWFDNNIYYTDNSGAIIKNQWFIRDNYWYCAQKDGAVYKNGLHEVDGKTYYFGSAGDMATGLILVDGDVCAYLTDESGVILTTEGWTNYNLDWYYINSKGEVALSQWIDGHYYVDDSGDMVIGSRMIDGIYYYFDNNGYLVTDTASGTPGWQFSNGYWYYFDENGKPYDGWVDSYFIEHGRMLTNTLVYDEENNVYYYVGPDGTYVKNGWNTAYASRIVQYSGIGQSETVSEEGFYGWTYADADGVLSSNEWEYINGNWYYFGLFYMCNNDSIEIDGTDYWFDDNGICLNPGGTGSFGGWTYIDEGWYYFKEDGSLLQEDTAVIDGVTYYFDYNGRMRSDAVDYDYETKKLIYINSNGIGTELSSGWHFIQNQWYYIDEDGTIAEGLRYINDTYYYFTYEGRMSSGWYYVEEWDGTYFFNESGAWQDTSQDGWYFDGYNWYYVQNGKPLKGVQTINGTTYCLSPYNGAMCVGPASLFYNTWDIIFIYGDDGAPLYNSWYYHELSGEWYYSDEYGHALKGEHTIDGTTYWFNEDGVWVK